jgi:hypothetical protein
MTLTLDRPRSARRRSSVVCLKQSEGQLVPEDRKLLFTFDTAVEPGSTSSPYAEMVSHELRGGVTAVSRSTHATACP